MELDPQVAAYLALMKAAEIREFDTAVKDLQWQAKHWKWKCEQMEMLRDRMSRIHQEEKDKLSARLKEQGQRIESLKRAIKKLVKER